MKNIIGVDTRLTISGDEYPWRIVLAMGKVKRVYKIPLPSNQQWLNDPWDDLYGSLLEGRGTKDVAYDLAAALDGLPVLISERHKNLRLFEYLNVQYVRTLIDEEDTRYESEAEISSISKNFS